LFNGYGVLVLENENCSEMDGSDDCAAVWIYLMSLKNGWCGKFYVMCILTQPKLFKINYRFV
jgi:hypothetical protein